MLPSVQIIQPVNIWFLAVFVLEMFLYIIWSSNFSAHVLMVYCLDTRIQSTFPSSMYIGALQSGNWLSSRPLGWRSYEAWEQGFRHRSWLFHEEGSTVCFPDHSYGFYRHRVKSHKNVFLHRSICITSPFLGLIVLKNHHHHYHNYILGVFNKKYSILMFNKTGIFQSHFIVFK